MLNIECKIEAISEIRSSFKFNDSIIRSLVLSTNKAKSDLSALSRQTEKEESEYLKEKDKTEESKPESLRKEEEKTAVKEGAVESIKAESESPDE